MKKIKIAGMLLRRQSVQYEQTEHQSIWLIMLTTTFVDVWKLRSKLPKLSKRLWTTFNRCSLNSSITEITMIPGVTMMRKNILAMTNRRRRSPRRGLP